jgi:hypothetical protein
MEYKYKPPTYNHGNRCGHLPEFPTFYERSPNKKKTYEVIHTAHENLKKYYHEPKKYLNGIHHSRYYVDNGSVCHMKTQRSESREAVARVLGLIIDCCDLETMRSVVYKDGKATNISLLYIAMFLGLTYKRVYRALRVLQQNEYITFDYQSRYIGDKFVKIVAIKKISRKAFIDLDVSTLKLEMALHHARTKHETRVSPRGGGPRVSSPVKSIGTVIQQVPQIKQFKTAEEARANVFRLLAKHRKPPPS